MYPFDLDNLNGIHLYFAFYQAESAVYADSFKPGVYKSMLTLILGNGEHIMFTLSIKGLIVLDRHVLPTYVNTAFNCLQI